MPLQKFPVEVPLGGAVDEGNVPEIVQPPRILEARDCASLTGGAYEKRDGYQAELVAPAGTIAISHGNAATTTIQETSLAVFPDDGSAPSPSFPSPVTGRPVHAYFPTEGDAVKQHGDHATMAVSGVERTLACWNVDPAGGYQLQVDYTGAATNPATPTSCMWRDNLSASPALPSSSGYQIEGAWYAMFDGSTQKGPERPYAPLPGVAPAPDRPVGFPRVRADDAATQPLQAFWSCVAIGYELDRSVGVGALDRGEGFVLSGQPAPGGLDARDILNQRPNASNDYGALPIAPGCQLVVHDTDGNYVATATTEDGSPGAGADLLPALELLLVPGEGVYTLHPRLVGGVVGGAVVRKWQFTGGQIIPDPTNPVLDLPPIVPPPNDRTWPAGLHDTGSTLMITWDTTVLSMRTYDFGFIADRPTTQFGFPADVQAAQQLTGSSRTFARQSRNTTGGASFASATNLTRGIWAGSFLAPVGDGTYWVGIQIVSGDGTSNGLTATPRQFPMIFSSAIVHALVDVGGNVVANSIGVMPGSAIGSQGLEVDGVGACVGIYACAPGDSRTAQAQICGQAFVDIPTSTYLLIARREIPELADVPLPIGMTSPDVSAANQAVTILQAEPQGHALGTYQINPFQVRTNLFVRADGQLSAMTFERGAPSSFRTDDLGDGLEAQTRVGGDASRARPRVTWVGGTPDIGLTRAGDYLMSDGAQPVSSGGPQAPAAGWGPQLITDCPVLTTLPGEADPGMFSPDPLTQTELATPNVIGTAASYAGHAVTYDESGGQRRTVPSQAGANLFFVVGVSPASGDEYNGYLCAAYPLPYPLLGLANSERALGEIYLGGADDASDPQQVGQVELYPIGYSFWNTQIYGFAATPGASLRTLGGSEETLYVSSGELAADAPDPSRAVAAANSRLWSVSAINPRQAQYTKFLRRGYAPEWNANLTVRVPGSADPLTSVGILPDGRVLLFSATAVYYTYGEGPSDTGQGAGFAEPALLTDTVGCVNKHSIVFGEFGCLFRGERGFYLVDRALALSFVGLPYEDTTRTGQVQSTAIDGLRSEVLFFTDVPVAPAVATSREVWTFNYLRQQWSTFALAFPTIGTAERDARPLTLDSGGNVRGVTTTPPALSALTDTGRMGLRSGWLAMGRIQGFGRMWEIQIAGAQDPASTSGMQIEVMYDYVDAVAETFNYDVPSDGAGRIHLRIRPARQKCEAVSIRCVETAPVPSATTTGWRVDMVTLLCGVKAGIDKLATTEASP